MKLIEHRYATRVYCERDGKLRQTDPRESFSPEGWNIDEIRDAIMQAVQSHNGVSEPVLIITRLKAV